MPNTLTDLFRKVELTGPRSAGGLTVFGLRSAEPSGVDYSTLDEALSSESLTISEMSEGGTVPTLKLVNRTGRRVFLMAGEQLIGAKQNRVLNTSILVEAGAELPIPVSCVEQGRWDYRSRHFGSHGTAAHGKLRRLMTEQVAESYSLFCEPISDQCEVWNEVSRKMSSMGSHSESMALEQAYLDRSDWLDEADRELEAPDDCVGAVFVRNGRIVGADVFDRPETLKKLWTKLVRAHAIDALEEPDLDVPAPETKTIRDWLEHAARAEAKSYRSPGLGDDLRLKADGVIGAGLVVDGRPVHVQLFSE